MLADALAALVLCSCSHVPAQGANARNREENESRQGERHSPVAFSAIGSGKA